MFRVRWRISVELILLESWAMAAPDVQAEISNAINALERRLGLDPLNESESRVDDERIAFERPLAVMLSVDTTAKIVTIEDAWLYE